MMLQGFFNYDNPIWRFVGRLGDMIVLNLLWFVCSIPVVTIGASTTALYYCTLKYVRNEDYGDFRMFFRSFKQNFKQATLIWVPMQLIAAVLGFDFYFFGEMMAGAGTVKFFLQAVVFAMIIVWIFVFLYVWPVLSRFENTTKNTILNAILMSIRYLGSTISMLICDVVILLVWYILLFYMPWLSAFLMLMGVALIAWINSTMFEHIFQKFMPKEDHSHDGDVRPILEDINMDGSLKEGAAEETGEAISGLKKSSEDEI